MKKSISKKFLAVTLSAAMLVTSVTVFKNTKDVKAEDSYTVVSASLNEMDGTGNPYTNETLFPDVIAASNTSGTNLVTSNAAVTATAPIAEQSALINDGTRNGEALSKAGEEYVINLGSMKDLKQFGFYWEAASATKFTISLSTDGSNYSDVALVSIDTPTQNNRRDIVTLTNAQSAQYIKVKALKLFNDGWGAKLIEFSAFGGESTNQPIVPIEVKIPVADKIGNEEYNILKGIQTIYQSACKEGTALSLTDGNLTADPHYATMGDTADNWIAFDLGKEVKYSDIESLYIAWKKDANTTPNGTVKVYVTKEAVLANPVSGATDAEQMAVISTDSTEAGKWIEVYSANATDPIAYTEGANYYESNVSLTANATDTFRYIKIELDASTNRGWGVQLNEVALLQAKKAEEPTTTVATETTTATTETTTASTETTTASTETTTASTETTTASTETTTASTETTTASTETTETTTAATETTTVAGETTASTETTTPVVTTKAPVVTTKDDVKKPGKATVATASKKKAAKKAKISLKKVARAKGYEVKISTNKKFKKSNTITKTVKKVSFTVKKLKANKKYYVKARAYVLSGKTKKFGAWSNVKRMTLK